MAHFRAFGAVVCHPGALELEHRAGRTLWSSGTHARGAHLTIPRGGNLEIVTPGGRVEWQSHTGGHSDPAYLGLCIANMQIDAGHQELLGQPFTTDFC